MFLIKVQIFKDHPEINTISNFDNKNDYKANIIWFFLEYQTDFILPQRQYNATTYVKLTIQVCD